MAERDKGIVPGRGFVFYADPDTAAPDLTKFDPNNPETCFEGWTWLGVTSKENMVALSKEGGESNIRDTWEYAGIRVEVSAQVWSATVNALALDQATLELAFPGGKWDSVSQSYAVTSNAATVDKAVLILMIDARNGIAAFEFPNGAIGIGEAPALSADGFLELQLNIMGQQGKDKAFAVHVPRKVTSGA